MKNKEEGYYYSYELFKSIREHNNKKQEILNDIMNYAIQEDMHEYIVNLCLNAIKVCELLSKKMIVIEELRRADDQIQEDKIALAGSEIKEIKELGQEIEELEEGLATFNLSANFH